MKCSKCGKQISKQLWVPNVYLRDKDKVPLFSYSYKCDCLMETVLTLEQFKQLDNQYKQII